MRNLLFLLLAFAPMQSAAGAVYNLDFDGELYLIDGNANGDLIAGDPVTGHFSFDTGAANLAAVLPLGGGTYSIYDAPVSTFRVSIGSYSFHGPVRPTVTYMDNAWGGDAVVFSVGGLPGGPFGSTFANLQVRFNGPANVLDHRGTANGVPFAMMVPDFFVAFGGGAEQVRTFGTLRVSPSAIPEPSTWIAFIAGFGAVGAAIRRRGKAVRPSLA